MQYKVKSKMFLFVLAVGVVSLTGIISWNPVMGQTSRANRPVITKPIPTNTEARVLQRSDNVSVSWFSAGKSSLNYEELIRQLPERESMRTEKRMIKVGENSQPLSVIVVYDKDGNVRLCIGKASACLQLVKGS